MSITDLLNKLVNKRPKINVILTIPEEVINKGYKKVTMSVDELEFFGCYGLFKNEYIFKGKVKVEM